MPQVDVRWIQRFSNYNKALGQLSKFIVKQELSELEKQGLIKAFEYTYELGWNTIKDFYQDQGETNIQGSKDAIRLAYKRGLITDGEGWMAMVQSRILTTHSYDEITANKIADAIFNKYYNLFLILQSKLESLRDFGSQLSAFNNNDV